MSDSNDAHIAAPAVLGINVLRFAPPGPVQLTQPQRGEILREIDACRQRIADLKLALGDNAGWFDRAMAAERARDAARIQSGELAEALEGLLLACAPGMPLLRDSALDTARAVLLKIKGAAR